MGVGVRRTGEWVVLAGLAVLVTASCATKRDVRDLRDEMMAMQSRQDSLVAQLSAELRARNRELLDSVSAQTALVTRMRGDIGRQLTAMEQQLIITQELAGQSQRRLTEWRDEQEARQRNMELPPEEDVPGGVSGTPSMEGSPEELYAVGMDQLRREAPGTARQAFRELLRLHPEHPRAADAQLQIAETFILDQDHESAFEAFERVVQDFPESGRAPEALYRAGILAEEQGDEAAARQYFERVISGFPNSDQAESARRRVSDSSG